MPHALSLSEASDDETTRRAPLREARKSGRRRSRHPVLTFMREFVASPTRMGAIFPSSRDLARAMLSGLDIAGARAIVEYGPGTGVVTDLVVPMLPPGCTYLAIERSEEMAAIVRAKHPGLPVYVDTAANVVELCRRSGVSQVDIVLCGLPWASLPEAMQTEILDATMRVLRPGGVLATFCYYTATMLPGSRRFFRRLPGRFSRCSRSRPVMRNLPPAFVLRCTR
jgi:phospholipid N-methyltransferase